MGTSHHVNADTRLEAISSQMEAIRATWLGKLRGQQTFDGRDLSGVAAARVTSGRDLPSVWWTLLNEGADAEEDARSETIANIHRRDYSISDFNKEVNCLKEAIGEHLGGVLTGRDAVSAVHALQRDLDRFFGSVLDQTSLIHETVLEGSSRGFCQVDGDGRIVFANLAFNKMVKLEDSRGSLIYQFFPRQEDFLTQYFRTEQDKEPVIRRMFLENADSSVPVNAEFGRLLIVSEEVGGWVTVSDVSSMVHAEEQAFETSKFGVIRVDTHSVITYANSIAIEIFGDSSAELVGTNVFDLFEDEESRRELHAQLRGREKGRSGEYELVYRRPTDHRPVPLRINAVPEYDSQGGHVGSMGFIRNLRLDRATERIQQAVIHRTALHPMLDAVIGVLRDLLAFDMAIVGIFSVGGEHWRPLHIEPMQEPMWETRWFPLDPSTQAWMEADGPHLARDLREFVKVGPGRAYEADPTTKRLVNEGMRAFMVLPVRIGDRLAGTFALMSRKENFYTASDYDVLTQLPIGEALQIAIDMNDREERDFVSSLVQQISRASNERDIARTIVGQLSEFYQWRNVAIFRVNPVRETFELMEQEKGPIKGFKLPKGFAQPIRDGVLGVVYKSQKPLDIPDVREGEYSNIYLPSQKKTRSELCVPVIIRGRVVWILNVEDSRVRAFCVEEMQSLQRIVAAVESFLSATFARLQVDEILEAATDGIVMTDLDGRIERMNPKAERMLSLKLRGGVGPSLADYIADEAIRRGLTLGTKLATTTVELRDRQGRAISSRLSGTLLPEEYGRWVFFLQDLSQAKRLAELETISGALYEIAAQTRMPLALAAGVLRRLRDRAPDFLAPSLDKVMRQLDKVETTYERAMLLGRGSGQRHWRPAPIDIGRLAESVLDELSPIERDVIDARIADALPRVRGDSYELALTLKSILNFLLQCRPVDAKIEVQARQDAATGVALRLTGYASDEYDPGFEGAQADSAVRARAEIALGEGLLRTFIETRHQGRYARRVDSEGLTEFEIELPSEAGMPGVGVPAPEPRRDLTIDPK